MRLKRLTSTCICVSAFCLVTKADAAIVPDAPPPEPIGYINTDPVPLRAFTYPGKSYEALVPATLDLADRAKLAINAFTETMNPNCDLESYYWFNILTDPATLHHSYSDHVRIKYMQALPYLRVASGSTQNLDREARVMQIHLQMQGPDGLFYTPFKGRPWGQMNASSGQWLMDAGVIDHPDAQRPHGDQLAVFTFDGGRALGGLAVYAVVDPDGPWREAARRMADALMERVIVEGDAAYLSSPATIPGWPISKPKSPPKKYTAAVTCQTAHGLAQYDRLVTGQVTRATELAAKLLRYILRDSEFYGLGGEFLNKRDGDESVHFHTHTMVLLAALEVVRMTGERDLLEMAQEVYDYAVSRGNSLVGYFPEHLHIDISTSETCEVADMVMAAIQFSHLGIDRWDDADRWIRNQFSENQLTQLNFINDGHIPLIKMTKMEDPYYTSDRVADRVLGSFVYWPSPNDLIGSIRKGAITDTYASGQSGCCTANGGKAVGYVWKHILTYDEGTLRVNLLLNRASVWADVDSHIPYKGQVDVNVKQDLDLQVRIPEWVEPADVRVDVDGQEREPLFDGRYAKCGTVKQGQTASVKFPMVDRTDQVTIQGFDYRLTRRGNTVVQIDPPGHYWPLYQRSHYRAGETLWKKKTRFVPEAELDW